MNCACAWGDQRAPGWLAHEKKQLSHTATWILTAISKTHVWGECYSALSVCAHTGFQSWLELHTDTVLKEIWVLPDMPTLKNTALKLHTWILSLPNPKEKPIEFENMLEWVYYDGCEPIPQPIRSNLEAMTFWMNENLHGHKRGETTGPRAHPQREHAPTREAKQDLAVLTLHERLNSDKCVIFMLVCTQRCGEPLQSVSSLCVWSTVFMDDRLWRLPQMV